MSAQPEPSAEGQVSSSINIVVVDDDKDVCEYLQDFLTADGYAVTCVNDPTQALDALREREYHVAVLDLMMPKLSGIDLLGQIRKVDDDIAVIMLKNRSVSPAVQLFVEHLRATAKNYLRRHD